MDAAELKGILTSRRSALKAGGAAAFLVSQAALFERFGRTPHRHHHPANTPAATTFSDIQFDMGAFINPAQVFNDGPATSRPSSRRSTPCSCRPR
jgi:hypothetical protein